MAFVDRLYIYIATNAEDLSVINCIPPVHYAHKAQNRREGSNETPPKHNVHHNVEVHDSYTWRY